MNVTYLCPVHEWFIALYGISFSFFNINYISIGAVSRLAKLTDQSSHCLTVCVFTRVVNSQHCQLLRQTRSWPRMLGVCVCVYATEKGYEEMI